ncbi:hypothetical protein KSP39_PZI016186 [Platanthera zijinensis]|uniref:Serine aminopeptidase S33 domain-containing protein n=1 Tax=Platanthera zijinensis TaxID=2320716 RepID=A0AAP0B7U5_9ASPA
MSSFVSKQRVEILNKHGEKLVGVLHSTGSKNLVILCHGFRSTKEARTLLNLIAALTGEGLGAFHFDFAGNGESDGEFQYGNYHKEVDDLHAIVLFFSEKKYKICAITGHSKGGNVVLLYASTHNGVPLVINLSGRFALKRGIDGRLGKDFVERIKKDGFIDVKDRTGKVEYRVTEESLMDRLNTDMHAACRAIGKDCSGGRRAKHEAAVALAKKRRGRLPSSNLRVLTIHGSVDEIVPSEDAFEFDKLIPNHKLHIIEGANHCYTGHQEELASLLLDFIKSTQVVDVDDTAAQLI